MWLNLRPPKQCGFKSHQVPIFSGVGIRKYTFFRSNIDHMHFCYGLIRVMWLNLRPPKQCGFKSHQVPTFSGLGIRKYTFFRPNIDHMPFCMICGICMAYGCNLMVGSNPTRCQLFRRRYKTIHLFPAKYRPYAFLLCADTHNVVAPSPARTVWVQIPPGANFFRCRYKQIHLFSAKYRPYAFLLLY